MKKILKATLPFLLALVFAIIACGTPYTMPSTVAPGSIAQAALTPVSAGPDTVHFVIGSENRAVMDDIVIPWFAQQKAPDGSYWKADYKVLGSVDQKILLQSGKVSDANGVAFNVMWPANKTWSLIGDTHHLLVDNPSPAFYTPIVLAWPAGGSIDELGWTGKAISLDDVTAQVAAGKQLWTSNLTQSNSGAIFGIGLWNKYAGNDPTTPLTMDQVNDPTILAKVQKFYATVNHSASSTGYVTDNCRAAPNCDFLVTYETLAIQNNLNPKQTKLHIAYISDVFMYSDATPQFVKNGLADDAAKQAIFNSFLTYMASPDGVQKLIAHGERPAQGGLRLDETDPTIRSIFNPDWGVNPTLKLQPITLPEGPVLEQLFYNYQVAARPAYDMVLCLDRSGSMQGEKWNELMTGLSYITDPNLAKAQELLANPNDLTTFITFSSDVTPIATVQGADYGAFGKVYQSIAATGPGGNTDIYGCLSKALEQFAADPVLPGRKHLLLLMTDGQQTINGTLNDYLARWQSIPDLSVIAVGIGIDITDIDVAQLHQIVDPMKGTVIVVNSSYQPAAWNEVQASDVLSAMKQAVGSK
ncbi:MAG: VWA domain-containing protein [Anaerolineales bacterium]